MDSGLCLVTQINRGADTTRDLDVILSHSHRPSSSRSTPRRGHDQVQALDMVALNLLPIDRGMVGAEADETRFRIA